MRETLIIIAGLAVGVAALASTALPASPGTALAAAPKPQLRQPSAFVSIKDEHARSVALFQEMSKVITSPRCMNCHPRDDTPRQGDNGRLHQPAVIRGEADGGAPGLPCTTCHGTKTNAFVGAEGSIPGHHPWRLAPLSMGWIGLTKGEICQQLKDSKRNGGRSLEAIIEHHKTDALVGSAWHNGGKGRASLPGDQKTFGELTQAWVESGAACPT